MRHTKLRLYSAVVTLVTSMFTIIYRNYSPKSTFLHDYILYNSAVFNVFVVTFARSRSHSAGAIALTSQSYKIMRAHYTSRTGERRSPPSGKSYYERHYDSTRLSFIQEYRLALIRLVYTVNSRTAGGGGVSGNRRLVLG